MTDKRYPPSSYGAKYPYNRVTVTESGIEWHLDDTPGAERVRLAHPSGTHFEYSSNGRATRVVVGDSVSYTKGGSTSTTDGNVDEKVGGSTRSSVHGDSHREVAGADSSMTQGDRREIVGGDHVTAVSGERVAGYVGGVTMKVGGSMQLKGDAVLDAKVDGSGTIQFGGDVTIESLKSLTIKVGGASVTIKPDSIVASVGNSQPMCVVLHERYAQVKWREHDDMHVTLDANTMMITSGKTIVVAPDPYPES